MTALSSNSAGARWTVSVGRVRGSSHVRTQSPCQDDAAYRSLAAGEAVVLAVSDGAGSGSLTHLASAVAVRSATFHVAAHYDGAQHPEGGEVLSGAAAQAREDVLALYRACVAVDRSAVRLVDFACTLLLVLATSADVTVLQIGDGAVVADCGGVLSSLSSAVSREYVNETDFLTDGDGLARAHRRSIAAAPVDAIAVMSDGVQHHAVDPRHVPFAGFFGPVFGFARAQPPPSDQRRSEALLALLSDETIDDITDDDRTLVVAIRDRD